MSNNTTDNGSNIDSNVNNYIAATPTAPPNGGGPMSMKRERSSIEVNAGDPNNDDASQQSTPASVNGPEPKKRKSAPGSRGVANLTPEQLAKKRANDREAQRAIRERTKLTIESLERRIRELTSQQPYQELQAALRAKEAVEAENADIKRRLASIMAMIHPLITQCPSEQPALPSPGQSFLPVPTNPTTTATTPGAQSNVANNISTPSSAASPSGSADPYTQWNSAASTSSGPVAPQAQVYRAQLSQQRHDLAHGLELGSERLGLDFLLDQAKGSGGAQSVPNGGTYDPANYRHPPPESNSPFARASGVARDATIQSNIDPALQNAIDPALTSAHSTAIKNCAPTCPLDSLLLDFLQERRQRAAEGFPPHEIIGPRYPSIVSLLNPTRDTHPLTKLFIDILNTFPNINQLPERVGVLYVMFLIMRWQIEPSQDNYDRLPDFVRPLPSQLYNAHPAWVDHLPFPAMRDRLIRDFSPPDVFPFGNFFIPFTTTLSLNWPYEDTDALLQAPESDELMINPVFERHLRRRENWTLGEAFARAFPSLEGTYNLRTDDKTLLAADRSGIANQNGRVSKET